MTNKKTDQKEEVTISKKDYLKLMEAYKKMGQVSALEKKFEGEQPETLYGIWEGTEVNEEDFKKAENSLFKS